MLRQGTKDNICKDSPLIFVTTPKRGTIRFMPMSQPFGSGCDNMYCLGGPAKEHLFKPSEISSRKKATQPARFFLFVEHVWGMFGDLHCKYSYVSACSWKIINIYMNINSYQFITANCFLRCLILSLVRLRLCQALHNQHIHHIFLLWELENYTTVFYFTRHNGSTKSSTTNCFRYRIPQTSPQLEVIWYGFCAINQAISFRNLDGWQTFSDQTCCLETKLAALCRTRISGWLKALSKGCRVHGNTNVPNLCFSNFG